MSKETPAPRRRVSPVPDPSAGFLALLFGQPESGNWYYAERPSPAFHLEPGTGGNALSYFSYMVSLDYPTSPYFPSSQEQRSVPTVSPEAKIARLRSTLSLNISEVAAALRVERPTIYAWIGGRTRPQQGNLARLDLILRVARRWSELTPQPLGRLREERFSGRPSLQDLLVSEQLDFSAINATLELARRVLVEQGAGARSTSRRPATQPSHTQAAQDEIDILTGKRLAAE